ncbi:MAG: CRISPR-associated endonuclease Cas1 [Verrucomicrobiia bacterium]
MPTAFIQLPLARIKLHSERLLVLAPPEPGQPDTLLQQIPLAEVDSLIVTEQVQITSQAVGALLRRNAVIHYLTAHGRLLGSCLPPTPPDGRTRLSQYRRAQDADFSLSIARRVVESKIYNQIRVLQRAQTNREGQPSNVLSQLSALLDQAGRAKDVPSLLGCEGAAAAEYFRIWSAFLPSTFPFEHRSTRPPHNAVNACLSFGSTLIYHELVTRIYLAGLDPALGHLHTSTDDRCALALDLMEPFRPAISEALTLRLFTQGILAQEDFEPQEGGVYLSADGRKKWLLQYERRMEREFMSEFAGHRTTLRRQLDQIVAEYKRGLADPETFRPFRVN